MFGGNSNWRGPIWMPMQLMLIRALVNQYAHLGNNFKVECPAGSGRQLTLLEVSQEIARRLSRLFLRNNQGHRPSHGTHAKWKDEHWRDHVLFYEYFHGDSGAGIGASHQTGWTGVIAFLIQGFKEVEAEKVLEKGMIAVAEVSAEVARASDQPQAVQVAEEVHEEVAEKVVAQVMETVQQQVTEVMQEQAGQVAEKIQEKVEQIVMEKIAETVQEKAEEVTPPSDGGGEKKDVL
jgi:hypothetical protein